MPVVRTPHPHALFGSVFFFLLKNDTDVNRIMIHSMYRIFVCGFDEANRTRNPASAVPNHKIICNIV